MKAGVPIKPSITPLPHWLHRKLQQIANRMKTRQCSGRSRNNPCTVFIVVVDDSCSCPNTAREFAKNAADYLFNLGQELLKVEGNRVFGIDAQRLFDMDAGPRIIARLCE